MKIIHDPLEMRMESIALRNAGKKTGFVPTMGALHNGHIFLLKEAKKRNDITIMSIFVNPAQFGKNEDFNKYPRPFEEDCRIAEMNGCDILFAPAVDMIYPENYATYITVERLSEILEGAIRPDHFKGVTTIVLKLFNIVQPVEAIFGQKDIQQAIILRKMVIDLNIQITIHVLPTVREKDGLALSSRNIYLTDEERKAAPLLYKGLCWAVDAYKKGEDCSKRLEQGILNVYFQTDRFLPQYIAIVDVEKLEPVSTISSVTVIAVACKTAQSHTRLIDNVLLNGEL